MDVTVNTVDDAIKAALACDWQKAISINKILLEHSPDDIDSMNRLGYALLQSGKINDAKKIFNKILKIDQYNHIAQKNLKKSSQIKTNRISIKINTAAPKNFIEEPGTSHVATCLNVAPESTLACVSPGQEVLLCLKKRSIEVRSGNKEYLGALPDDLSFRLIKMLNEGNTYLTIIQRVGKNSLTVLIHELSRGKKFRNHPSFR